ncbi:MAG: hypothetical protein LBR96_02725 [Treponema sp.]|jgi:hypothetical protein|nr:hypothetical protein [Treponema sp.]
MRKLVLILIMFIAVVTFMRVFDNAGAQTPSFGNPETMPEYNTSSAWHGGN